MADQRSAAPRTTPYELVFRAGGLEAEALPAIAEEAAAIGIDPSHPERFVMLSESGKALRRMRPEGTEGGPGAAIAEYAALLFHGFHFWRADLPLFVVDDETLRALLAPPPEVGAWTLAPPAPAGYAQLPRHRVWLPATEGVPPEPVDGFFWTTTSATAAVGGPAVIVHLALISGVRPDRPGFGVVDVSAPIPPPPAAHWADVKARAVGADFENILPGGDIEGHFAVTSVAEALRLASLLFWHAREERVGPVNDPPAASPPDSPHAHPPTTLRYRRISIAGEDG